MYLFCFVDQARNINKGASGAIALGLPTKRSLPPEAARGIWAKLFLEYN